MARRLYSALTRSLAPVAVARLLLKSRRNPDYRKNIGQRFGYGNTLESVNTRVWVHCVSVGETIAAAGLIKELIASPQIDRVLVTSTTPTGAAQVFNLFGNRVERAMLPFDTPGAVQRFLTRVRPTLAVLMETELWPNLIHGCWRQDIPVILANARLSERSAKRYARWPKMTRTMIRQLDHILAQYKDDSRRFIELGADPFRVSLSGNIKFDIELNDHFYQRARNYLECWGVSRPIWIAASTHSGEERIALEAHRQILQSFPKALLVIVPRHQERFDEVSALVHEQDFETVRQSAVGGVVSPHARVVVVDLLGELLTMYGAANVAFVGGSLIDRGGHNMVEPAAWGIPVISGPSIHNFSDIGIRLKEADALITVTNAGELAETVTALFADKIARQNAGRLAQRVVAENRGATAIHIDKITELLESVNAPY